MKKILILGSQHGNELLGEALHAYIQRQRPELLPYITYLPGNIRARQQNIRYIESDLNRSYNGRRTTYEERRAGRILAYIKRHAFDLVLDMHTTTCDQPPCLIVASPGGAIAPFLRACSIDKIVHMNHEIVKTTLIGVCPEAVAIEVNKHALSETLLTALSDDLQRYIDGNTAYAEKTVYEVGDLLKKTELSEEEASKLQNFQKSSHGFYPILVGENSYKKQTAYLGFKAYSRVRSRV
jgi:succinylglutamate desuccinylase